MKASQLFIALLSVAAAYEQTVDRDVIIHNYQAPMEHADYVQGCLNDQLMGKNTTVTSGNGIVTFVNTVAGQIDHVIGMVSDALTSINGDVADDISAVLLDPFVQSVTNGAQTLLVQLLNGGIQFVDSTLLNTFVGSSHKLCDFADQQNVDSGDLSDITVKIEAQIYQRKKRDTDGYDYSGYQSSVDNAQQAQDSLNRQFSSSNSSRSSNKGLNSFISGIDAQVNNVISLVSEALSPITGGLSKQIGNLLLSPFVQTATQGAEQLVESLAGDALNLLNPNALSSLVGSFSKLITMGKNNNVDVSRLVDLNQQIMNTVPSSPSGSDSQPSDSQGSNSQGGNSQGSNSQGTDSQSTDPQYTDPQYSDSYY